MAKTYPACHLAAILTILSMFAGVSGRRRLWHAGARRREAHYGFVRAQQRRVALWHKRLDSIILGSY
ncbi:MAG: hypothetical protein GKR97_13195 [Rhizobiaceae bacterium]|nr:hypothetical protein [Rhizobiaceae bacterium]